MLQQSPALEPVRRRVRSVCRATCRRRGALVGRAEDLAARHLGPRRAPAGHRGRARPAWARPGSRWRSAAQLAGAGWCLAGASRRRGRRGRPGAGGRGDPPRAGGEAALPERLVRCRHRSCCSTTASTSSARWPHLVRSLLDAVPQLRVLATSQVPLGIEDEHLHALEPLTQDDSVALFTRRAQEMRRQLVLDDDATAAVGEVCRALDGLPLAIELAASRVRSLSVRDIARRLDDRFALLRDPNSQLPERRRALEGAIAWSYELLFPDDQRGLWALSCFAGERLAGRDRARARGARRTGQLGPRHDQPAGRPVPGHRRERGGRGGALPAARQHQGYAGERLRESGQADAAACGPRPVVRRGRALVRRSTCAATGSRSAWRSHEPNGPTSTWRWPGAPRTTPCSAYRSPTGSAGPGWCSATAPPVRPRVRDTLGRRDPCPRPRRRPCCSQGGSRRPPVTWRSPRRTSTGPARSR